MKATPASAQYRQAAELQERIEQLQAQLRSLLSGIDGSPSASNLLTKAKQQPKPKVSSRPKTLLAITKGHGQPVKNLETQKAKRQPRGALSSAVVAVLKQAGKPLNTAQIFEKLTARNFSFSQDEPRTNKKILGIRLYRLGGIKSLGKGLFTVAEK
jgi:hypothetical protein